MIISKSKRFIFVHIYKCAGESITTGLSQHLNSGDYVIGSTIKGKINERFHPNRKILPKHASVTEIRSYLGEQDFQNYLIVSSVRHPCDRIFSLYKYLTKLTNKRKKAFSVDWAKGQLSGFRKWPEYRILSQCENFSTFIRHPEFDTLPAARPMKDFLSADGILLVDAVIKLERLQEDMSNLADRLGLPAIDVPHINNSSLQKSHNTGSSLGMSEDDRDYLKNKYEDDMKLFDYQ